MKGIIKHLKRTIRTLKGRVRTPKEHENASQRATPSIHDVDEQEALVLMLLSGWNITPSGLYYPRR